MSHSPKMARDLESAGWTADRKPHEPVWWRDPMGLVDWMRTGEAWRLMTKRRAHGVDEKKGTDR